MQGRRTEECIYGTFAYLDDVVGHKTVRFPMDTFERFTVGTLGETEHRSFAVIEPISDIADSIVVLDGEVQLVRFGNLGSRGSWRIVTIKEERHAVRLVTTAKWCTVDGQDGA